MRISDLEKIIGIKNEILLRYLKISTVTGDLCFKIDEFNDEIEFDMENATQLEADIKLLKKGYENINHLQTEIIDLSFK